MESPFLVLLLSSVGGLLLFGLASLRRVHDGGRRAGWCVTGLSGLALAASVAVGVQVAVSGPMLMTLARTEWPVPLCVGVHLDGVAAVMAALISFIGVIIARYSTRYLQGDAGQARFFRWVSVTLGATLMLVLSCNLVMFTAAWMLTSLGLHQLLTYYPDRSWAVWAARKKFLISRLGDVMLLSALVLTFRAFGTSEYSEIFAQAAAIHNGTAEGGVWTSLIGVLLVLGAMTKSAQVPFHSWLPDTMETPTPVSALMHAGVINAGGFLVIRLSPLVSLSPVALDLLALIGGVTALFGGVVMLTQTSIKRSLAYSTIAQMGFMMLQCGLGAFSAALLHIVAHSAYKAHAFLSCGSVLDTAARMSVPAAGPVSAVRSGWSLAAAALVALGTGVAVQTAFGLDFVTKPGGVVLGLVLMLALTQLLWGTFTRGDAFAMVRGVFTGAAIAAAYCGAYLVMDQVVAASASDLRIAPSPLNLGVMTVVSLGFLAVFALQARTRSLAHSRWGRALYVHALNGFYIDIPARRLTARFYGQSAPVQ